MATRDKDGKLTGQMTSPGQAWMDYVNSKEGHNAAAVTPAYLEPQKQKDISKPQPNTPSVQNDIDSKTQAGFTKSLEDSRQHTNQKNINHERE